MEVQTPVPPDELYVRERRTATTGERARVFLTDKVEATLDKGILFYHTGATYPKKGWITPEAIYALNQFKRLFMEFLWWLSNPFFALWLVFSNKTKLMQSFNNIFDKIYETYVLKEAYLCPTATHFYRFLASFLVECGYDNQTSHDFAFRLAQIVEADDAYRYLIQDLATEYDVKNSPRSELKRLEGIYIQREERMGVLPKIRQMMRIVQVALLVPKYKRAFKKHSHLIKGMAYDEADWYWVCMRGEYNYGGKSWEDRQIGLVRPQAYYINP